MFGLDGLPDQGRIAAGDQLVAGGQKRHNMSIYVLTSSLGVQRKMAIYHNVQYDFRQ